MVLVNLLITVQGWASADLNAPRVGIEWMNEFHESEIPVKEYEPIVLSTSNPNSYFVVKYRNVHQEPEANPIHVNVGFKRGKNDFIRANRNYGHQSEPTYCEFVSAEVMTREAFAKKLGAELAELQEGGQLTVSGDYLILTFYQSNDSGVCDSSEEVYEVISAESLMIFDWKPAEL